MEKSYLEKLKVRSEEKVNANVPMDMPLTGLVVTILMIVLGIYDLAVVVFKGTGSSVSDFLIRTGLKAPFVVFVFGFVAGHLFGRMTPSGVTPVDNWWYLISCGVFGVFVGWGIRGLTKKPE
jgi:hypothetical protein